MAHHLAHRGSRVMAIDLDHQGNFTNPLRLSGRVAVAPMASDALLTGIAPTLPSAPSAAVDLMRINVPNSKAWYANAQTSNVGLGLPSRVRPRCLQPSLDGMGQ